MGLFKRMVLSATGVGPLDKTIEKVLAEIGQRAAQGHDDFVVSFTQTDVGALNRLDIVAPRVANAVQDAGHSVVAVEVLPWQYVVHLRVRPARASVAGTPTSPARGNEDPDLAEFHRAAAMAAQMPPGDLGASMTPEQLTQEARWLRQQYEAGNYAQTWKRRVQLGYGASAEGLSQADYFWLNAAPALAALKAGFKEHPMTAMCCGSAESASNSLAADQAAAVTEFNRLYFSPARE